MTTLQSIHNEITNEQKVLKSKIEKFGFESKEVKESFTIINSLKNQYQNEYERV